MDLFEYQGKELFAQAGLAVPRSRLARTVDEADEHGSEVGFPLAVKAQVLSGGRGKAGGVKLVRDAHELHEAAERILGMTIKDKRVSAVLLEEAVDIARELYLAITLDRHAKCPLLMLSTKGGMDIEQVARTEPEALQRARIDPLIGLRDFQVRQLALWAGFDREQQKAFAGLVRTVWSLFRDYDATLVELNPLCVTTDGGFVALDAKVTIDNNALYRHPGFDALQGTTDERERRAKAAGFAYVSLDGDIGVVGNGAGLVMSILDLIAGAGGRGADFLDVGGGVSRERIEAALDVVLRDERAVALVLVIFAGFTRCDEVARGLLAALDATGTTLPVVVRLTGTNAELGRAMLAEASRPNLFLTESIDEAAQKAVALAKERADESARAVETRE